MSRGGGRRRPTARQQEIAKVGRAARTDNKANGPRAGMQRLPGGNLPKGEPLPRGRGRGQEQGGGGQRAGVGRGEMPGLGHQLSRRVQSGAITREQAQRTARERQTLKKTFGEDWRQQVFGQAGRVQDARQRLAQNPNDPKLLALNQRLKQMREDALATAKARSSSNGGTTAPPQGAVPPASGNGGITAPRPSGVRRPPSAREQRPTRRRRRRQPAY